MEEEPPGGKKYDSRNSNLLHIRNSEQYSCNSILPIRKRENNCIIL